MLEPFMTRNDALTSYINSDNIRHNARRSSHNSLNNAGSYNSN